MLSQEIEDCFGRGTLNCNDYTKRVLRLEEASNDTPMPLSYDPLPGTSYNYARADHSHLLPEEIEKAVRDHNGNIIHDYYAPINSPTFTGEPMAPTPELGDDSNRIATTEYVNTKVDSIDAMLYMGVVNSNDDLPSEHVLGWMFRIGTAGTYANQVCEVGDMIICNTTGTTFDSTHWDVILANIDGAVVGPATSVDKNIVIYDGASGKVVKDSGVNIDDVYLKDDVDEIVRGVNETIENNELVTSAALNDLNSNKLNNLVSGTNIKTINGYSILGSGNISNFIPIFNHGTSDTTLAINPNEFHVWDDVPELEITLIPPEDINVYNKYMFQFGSGNITTVLNDIPNVKWVVEPNIEPCMIYQAVIVNNIGIIYGVSNENYEKYTIPEFMELIHKGAMLRTGYVSSEPTGDNVTKYNNNGLYAYYRNLQGFTYDFNMLSTLDYGNYYPLYGFNELILDIAETDVNLKSKQICLYETDTSSELAKSIIITDYIRSIQTTISSNDDRYGCDILFTNIIGETHANGRMYKVVGEPMIEQTAGDESSTSFVDLIENLHLVAFIDKGFNVTIGTDNLDGTYNFDLNSILTENSLTIGQSVVDYQSFSGTLLKHNHGIIRDIYDICVLLARSYNRFDIMNGNYSIFGIDMSNFIIPKRGEDCKYSFETNFAKFRLSFAKDNEGEYTDETVNEIYNLWQQLVSQVIQAEYRTGKTYTLPNMNDIKFIIPTDFRKWMLRES